MKTNTLGLTIRKVFQAKPAKVFKAFSNPQALVQWFKPRANIAIEVLEFEFRVGGTYRLRYTMADGSQPILGGKYLRIDQPGDLAFTWAWEAPDRHAHIDTCVEIKLLDLGEKTELVLTHQQLLSQEVADRHRSGWEATLAILQAYLKEPFKKS